MRPSIRALLIVLAGVLLVPGCMERKERLAIEPDGAVAMRLEFAADSFDELFLGDAVPRIEGGWLAVEDVLVDEEGRETFTLVAEATFAPQEELPSNYAAPRDPYPDVALQFPTSVTVERRRDGTYYHFHRIYDARPWTVLEAPRKELEEQLGGVGSGEAFEDLPIQQRAQIMRHLSDYAAVQLRHFARQAFIEVTPDAPQDHWLAISAAIDESYSEVNPNHLADLVLAAAQADPPAAGEEEAALQHELDRMEDATIDRIRTASQASGWHTVGRFNQFVERLERHRRFHEITSDLGDDQFEITITMPGEIIGHNGDSRSGNTVRWEFDGKAVRDRPRELMVSSRRR